MQPLLDSVHFQMEALIVKGKEIIFHFPSFQYLFRI